MAIALKIAESTHNPLKNFLKFKTDAFSNDKASVLWVSAKDLDAVYGIIIQHLFDIGQSIQRIQAKDNIAETLHIAQMASLLGRQTYSIFLDDYSSVQAKLLLGQLQKYTGPHNIIVLGSDMALIERFPCNLLVPEWFTANDMSWWVNFLTGSGEVDPKFYTALFSHKKRYSLTELYTFTQFGRFLGGRYQDFVQTWLPRLQHDPIAAYDVLHALLSKNGPLVASLLMKSQLDYGCEFWIPFLSDKIFAAAFYVLYLQEKLEVKDVSARLPYNFLNKDFRKHTFQGLLALHDLLFIFDKQFKTAGIYDHHFLAIQLVKYCQS